MGWDELDVLVVDDGVHTTETPYCDDPVCWCHVSAEYHELVIHPAYQGEDVERAYRFYDLILQGR